MTAAKKDLIDVLTKKMWIAFEGGRHGLFNQLAAERLRLLKSLDQSSVASAEYRKFLREIATQDQTWLDAALHKRGALRADLDRLRGRRSALRRLSRAYSKTPPQAQFFSRRG